MILEKNKEAVVTISGGGDESQFSINTDSINHLMDVLSQLYSKPDLAVVREYITNAVDSHIAAGKKGEPIDVRTPTRFNPMFEVQDYGLGLDEEDVRSIYSSYGTSTKQESNDFNGQLGLGCKAAFAIARQFSLTTVKNGKKYIFSLFKNEENKASVVLLDETPTEEKNGVTVSIPIKNFDSGFESTLIGFLKHFDSPVNLNNKPFPKVVPNHVIRSGDITFTFHNYISNRGLFIRMGGVLYPVENQPLNERVNLPGGCALLIDVPMGAVNFTPSREALKYNAVTLNFLEHLGYVITDVVKAESRIVQDFADKAKSAEEVIVELGRQNRDNFMSWFGGLKAEFRGVELEWQHAPFSPFVYDLDNRGFLNRRDGVRAAGFPRRPRTKYILIDTPLTARGKNIARNLLLTNVVDSVEFLYPLPGLTVEDTYTQTPELVHFNTLIGAKTARAKVEGPTLYWIKWEYGTPKIAGLKGNKIPAGKTPVLVEVYGNYPQIKLPEDSTTRSNMLRWADSANYVFIGVRTRTAIRGTIKHTKNMEKFLALGIKYITPDVFLTEYGKTLKVDKIIDKIFFNNNPRLTRMFAPLRRFGARVPGLDEIEARYNDSRINTDNITEREVIEILGKLPETDLKEKVERLYKDYPMLEVVDWDLRLGTLQNTVLLYIKQQKEQNV